MVNADKKPVFDILEPVAIGQFFAEYWEMKPLHISRSSNNPFESYISVDALERILSTQTLQFPQLQLSKAGTSLPSSLYTDSSNTVAPGHVSEQFKNGATIILSQAQKLHAPLLNLCRQMQRLFFMPCQTNTYYSPAGMQGFNPHYDTHDVFILQVKGRKTFRFYSERTMHPTSNHKFDKDVHKVGEETERIELSAGDLLYIPKGVVHDAVAHTDEPSLHITLGVYPVLYRDLLHELIDIASENNQVFRQAIPQSLWTGTDQNTCKPDYLRSLFDECMNAEYLDLALNEMRDRMAIESAPDISGVVDTPSFDESNSFCVRHDRIMHVEKQNQTIKIRLFGSSGVRASNVSSGGLDTDTNPIPA